MAAWRWDLSDESLGDVKYYHQVTQQMRRKGIEDARIVSTLNDVKGWVVQHPDTRPEEHFGPAAALVRDLPRGNTVHAPQQAIAAGLGFAFFLIIAQMIAGFFNVNLNFLGIPTPLWSVVTVIVGFVVSRFVGARLPEDFRP